jgi:hypothetical protein
MGVRAERDEEWVYKTARKPINLHAPPFHISEMDKVRPMWESTSTMAWRLLEGDIAIASEILWR